MNTPAPWQIATQLDLIPTPQHIALTGNFYALSGWRVMAAHGLPTKGLEVINRRIVELGGRALPHSGDADGESGLIVVVPWGHEAIRPFIGALNCSPDSLGEQGYVIRFIARQGQVFALLVGADPLGTLYAAETCARLIQTDASGAGPMLLEATVTDWPDYKRRCIGALGGGGGTPRWTQADDPLSGYLSELRPQVEWLARNKINYTVVAGTPSSRVDPLESRRAVARMAGEYGIRTRQTFGTSINDELSPQEWTECVTRGNAKFCWSAHDEHRRRARRLARTAAYTDLGLFCLHVIDAGGLADPECWSARCSRCRAVYGDDYVGACADLFLTYYTALKEEAPECEFEAVVYPYHYQWAVPDFAGSQTRFGDIQVPSEGFLAGVQTPGDRRLVHERLWAFQRELARRLPDDILITFREAGLDEIEAATAIWHKHPITPWVYFSHNHGWQGLWEPQQRYVRTWYRGHPKDCLFHAGLAYSGNLPELRAAACAEYAWNTRVPDSSTQFTLSARSYDGSGRRPSAFQSESLIPRVLRRMWGTKWGSFRSLFEQNLSLAYAANPLWVSNRLNDGEALRNPYEYLQEQADALTKASEDLSEYVQALDAVESRGQEIQSTDAHPSPADSLGYQCALYLYHMVHLAAAKSTIEATIKRAVELAQAGLDDAALQSLDHLIKLIPLIEERIDAVNLRVEGDRRVIRQRAGSAPNSTDGRLYSFRPSALLPRITRTASLIKGGDVWKPLRFYLEEGEASQGHSSIGATTVDPHTENAVAPVTIGLDAVSRREETVTYGYATLVEVAPYLALTSPIENPDAENGPHESARLITSILSGDDVIQVDRRLLRLGTWPWRPDRPIQFDLGLHYRDTLIVRLSVEAHSGERLNSLQVELDSL